MGIGYTAIILIPAMIPNPYFINVMAATPPINYFYIFNYHGSPFEALYNLGTMYYYGWFSINYVYAAIIIAIGIVGMTGFYYLQKLLQKFLYETPQKPFLKKSGIKQYQKLRSRYENDYCQSTTRRGTSPV